MALIDIASSTDIGLQRNHNEDNHLVLSEVGLLAVADGMGGLEKGEVASATAVDVFASAEAPLSQLLQSAKNQRGAEGRLQIARTLDVLNHLANEKIQEITGGAHSGTTLVAGMVADPLANGTEGSRFLVYIHHAVQGISYRQDAARVDAYALSGSVLRAWTMQAARELAE